MNIEQLDTPTPAPDSVPLRTLRASRRTLRFKAFCPSPEAQGRAHGTGDPAHLQSFVPQIPCDGEKPRVIPRYTRPDMGRIWSDENRFRGWLAVEVAATETLAEAGLVPREAAKAIRERADFKVERIHEI